MRKLLTTAATALALAGTLVAAAAPADAQRWRGGYGRGYYGRGYYHRGGGGGAAVVAGILGLGVGAAIASRPYYGYGGPRYYAPPPPAYYGSGYGYGGDYGYAPAYCPSDLRWDPYVGRYVRVPYC